LEFAKRDDFAGDETKPPAKVVELEKRLKAIAKERQFKSVGTRFDEEHQLWCVVFVNAQGAEHVLGWDLVSTPEYRQMMSKYKQISEYMQAPYVVEVARTAKETAAAATESSEAGENSEDAKTEGKTVKSNTPGRSRKGSESETIEKQSLRELFDYVLNEGRKEYTIQRYKGLGEMSAEQLWQTTMDPERRTLLSVKLDDLTATDAIFTTLMGENVEERRKFIEDNALDVKNLDI